MIDTLIRKMKNYISSQLINSGSHFQIFTETKIFGRSKFSDNTKFWTLLFSDHILSEIFHVRHFLFIMYYFSTF